MISIYFDAKFSQHLLKVVADSAYLFGIGIYYITCLNRVFFLLNLFSVVIVNGTEFGNNIQPAKYFLVHDNIFHITVHPLYFEVLIIQIPVNLEFICYF